MGTLSYIEIEKRITELRSRTIEVALYTSLISKDVIGTEATIPGYVRAIINLSAGILILGVGKRTSNTNTLNFGTSSSISPITVTHFAWVDTFDSSIIQAAPLEYNYIWNPLHPLSVAPGLMGLLIQ